VAVELIVGVITIRSSWLEFIASKAQTIGIGLRKKRHRDDDDDKDSTAIDPANQKDIDDVVNSVGTLTDEA
jgi:hypothetical protein